MNIISKFVDLYKNQFILSRSFIVIGASFIGNIFAYLFQLITGRYLSTEDYGVLISLFSLSLILSMFTLFFMSGIPKLVAEIKDINYPTRISELFYSIFKINGLITVLLIIGMILARPLIMDYLKIHDPIIINAFIAMMGATTLFSFINPFIQGLMRFKAFAFLTFVGPVAKLAIALGIMLIGLGIAEIFSALAFAAVATGILSFFVIRKNITLDWNVFHKADIKTLTKYSIGTAFALIGLNFLNNNDVVLAKHYFDPDMAGIYSSVSVIGRIIFYGASPVAAVMIPICAEKFKKGEDFMKPFLIASGLALSLASVAVIIYTQFSELIVRILFGERYIAAAEYIGLFALFMLVYTMMYVFAWFLISISKFKLGALVLVASAIQYFGIKLYWNNSIEEIIYVSMFATGSVLLVYTVILGKMWWKSKGNKPSQSNINNAN